MRILYLTQWFEPEPNIIKGLAFVKELEAAGHRVQVVTGFPNYPTGQLYSGYRLRPVSHETLEGVQIVRLPLYPSHDRSSVRRSLNYLSFFCSALIYCLLRARRFDLVYAYHPPITVGLAAVLGSWPWRRPTVVDVQDLWPDTIAATGMAGAAQLSKLLGWACAIVYKRASRIIVQSEGIRRALIVRGVSSDKVTSIANWALSADFPTQNETARSDAPFRIVYGGNFGLAQGLATVVRAAEQLAARTRDIEIHLFGDGVQADDLRIKAGRIRSLHIHERIERKAIERQFQSASALLLHLRDEPLFRMTIPSKVQFYLSMGRPIVAAIAGEAAEMLQKSGAAIVVPPEEPDALAAACQEMAALDPARREAMARAGRAYYEHHLSFRRGMDATLAEIEALTRQRGLGSRAWAT